MSAGHLEAMERREEMLLQLGAALQHLEKEYDQIKADLAMYVYWMYLQARTRPPVMGNLIVWTCNFEQ